jgi:hypothetical protein
MLSLALPREQIEKMNDERLLRSNKKGKGPKPLLLIKDDDEVTMELSLREAEREEIRAQGVRSFRIVQLHDMWIEMNSSYRGVFLMGEVGVDVERVSTEIERREMKVHDIGTEMFERLLEQKNKASNEMVLSLALENQLLMNERAFEFATKKAGVKMSNMMWGVSKLSSKGPVSSKTFQSTRHYSAKRRPTMYKANSALLLSYDDQTEDGDDDYEVTPSPVEDTVSSRIEALRYISICVCIFICV